jgi:prepilin-type N-terminal cleavage/methylation domain-containing protein
MLACRHSRTNEKRPGRAGHGFTLIEVLVVVAIIALLIAILLPALKTARWQAKVLACRANQHDLGAAFTIYSETSAGYFPLTPDASTDTFCTLWRAHLLKNPQVVLCPATENRVRPNTVPLAMNTSTETQSDLYHAAKAPTDSSGGHSYEYNGCYNKEPQPSQYPRNLGGAHKKTTTFTLPPYEMALVHDEDQDFRGAAGCTPVILANDYWAGSGNNCPQPWDNHGETGMNMLFGDTHAQWAQKARGMVIDYSKATPGSLPAPKLSVNAEIERIWIKSQWPWRVHTR